MFRVQRHTDANCRCDCCPLVPVSGSYSDPVHEWNADALPHPYTIDTETFGGAVINSYSVEIVDPVILFAAGPSGYQPSGTGSFRMNLDITAPSGRWDAWLILWMPSSSVPIEEVLDVTDPNGIVLLNGFQQQGQYRLGNFSHNHADGPYPVFGLVAEYDGQRYYSPHSYIDSAGNNPNDPSSVDEQYRPYCWRNVGNSTQPGTINPTTLEYNNDWPVECAPSPASFTRLGHVIGLTTVGYTGSEDRNASGNVTASIDIDNPAAREVYTPSCACWWAPPIPTLTATFETAPTEIEGDTITLNRQPDGTFTASGTFGPDSDPYSLQYTPCGSLVLTFGGCGLVLTTPHREFTADNFNGYLSSSQWRPIDLRFTNRVCFDGTFSPVPDCGLTPNSTLPVGSPPFVQIWQCFLFTIRLEE